MNEQSILRRSASRTVPMRIIRALLPSPGNVLFTLLAIGTFIWVQSAGALPLPGLTAAGTSTSTISYQGRLTNPSGTPVTSSQVMIFRLYNVATGGPALWEETWAGANSIAVNDGLFNVLLGSLTPIPQTVLTGNSTLWLSISVGTDAEMTPRVQLGSVPYAVQALTVLDNSVTAAKLVAGAVTQQQSVSTSATESTSSTSFVDMAGQAVTLVTTGGSVLVMYSGSHHSTAGSNTGYWRIVRDDAVVLAHNNWGFPSIDWQTHTMFGIDTPPAGSHTYKVQWRANVGSMVASEGTYTRNLSAIELKK